MLLFQKEAKQMANVAHLVKVNLTPSITLTPSVMFFFYLKPVHNCTISVGKNLSQLKPQKHPPYLKVNLVPGTWHVWNADHLS